ncbi:MAG: hypothetical protein ABIH53_01430, partial [archaeon]
AGKCLVGFSLEEGVTGTQIGTPSTGDIQNCEIGSTESTDISFAFNKEIKNAKVQGKGCTLSKTGVKIYVYNSGSCSMDLEGWTVLDSGKGTYMTFIKEDKIWTLFEGRFVPKNDPHTFRLKDEEYSIPLGGILNYKNGKFDVDLGNIEKKEFSITSYKDSKAVGATTIRQTGDTKPQITHNIGGGYDIAGSAEITSPTQKINMIRGDIAISPSGTLDSIGENTILEAWLPELDKSLPSNIVPGLENPQNMIKITTPKGSERISFSDDCEGSEGPSMSVCSNNKKLEISLNDAKGIRVEHIKSYKTTEETTLKEVVKDLKSSSSAFKQNKLQKKICDLNPQLQEQNKNCGSISAGEEIQIRTKSLEVLGDGQAKMTISEGVSKLASTTKIKSEGYTVNPEDKTVKFDFLDEEGWTETFETAFGSFEERQDESEIPIEDNLGKAEFDRLMKEAFPKEITVEELEVPLDEPITVAGLDITLGEKLPMPKLEAIPKEDDSRDIIGFCPVEPTLEPLPTASAIKATGRATKGIACNSKVNIVLTNPEAETITIPATLDESGLTFDELSATKNYKQIVKSTTKEELSNAISSRSLSIEGTRSGTLDHPSKPITYRRFISSETGSCITLISSDSTTVRYVDANCDMVPGAIMINYASGEKACYKCKNCANPCSPKDIREAAKLTKIIDGLMKSS